MKNSLSSSRTYLRTRWLAIAVTRLLIMILCGLSGGLNAAQAQTRAYVASPCSQSAVIVIDTATSSVVTTIAVEQGPFGIKITPDGTRAYVANQGTNRVSVINTATNTVIASIPVDFTPTPLAISGDGTRVYSGNQGGNSVSAIDTVTNTVIATIPVDALPGDLAVTPDGTRV